MASGKIKKSGKLGKRKMSGKNNTNPLIVFAADHGGFKLKEALAKSLAKEGLAWLDVGAHQLDPSDDYPEYGIKAAKYIGGKNKESIGIFVCSTGAGMCIAANKHKGVIAVNARSPADAKLARAHNNANVLCIGGKSTPLPLAKRIVKSFLESKFEGGRHARRVAMLSKIR